MLRTDIRGCMRRASACDSAELCPGCRVCLYSSIFLHGGFHGFDIDSRRAALYTSRKWFC
jgi:hypothetical protein